ELVPAAPRDSRIIPALLGLLSRGSPAARAAVIAELGKRSWEDPRITKAMIRALGDPDAEVRAKAAKGLGQVPLPSDAREALTALVPLLSSRFADPEAYCERAGGRNSTRQLGHRRAHLAGIRGRSAAHPVRLRSSMSWAIQVFREDWFPIALSVFS